MAAHPEYADNVALQKANIPYVGILGHVRYGTFGKIVSRVFILFTSEQLDAQEFDISWEFHMTNVKELFKVSWN
jgi:amidophosphoribosyltransferase